MTEAEHVKRQEVRRQEQEGLDSQKAELGARVAAQRDLEDRVAIVTEASQQGDPRGRGIAASSSVIQRMYLRSLT